MKHRWLLFSILFTGFVDVVRAASSFDLNACYRAALQKSEDVASQRESLVQSQERLNQVRGALLPTISGSAVYTREDDPASVKPSIEQNTVKLTADQPLFRGFRDLASLRQQRALVDSQRVLSEQTQNQVFQLLVQSFYQVVASEKDLENLKNEVDLNQKRLKDLVEFRKIGRARDTELLTFQTNQASLEAQIEAAKGAVLVARDNFSYLTGMDREAGLMDTVKIPAKLDSVESYLARLESRPDIRALDLTSRASEQGVAIARGGHLPSLDLLGNYYFQRPSPNQNSHWDVGLSLSVPIFQGGVISSQVRQAVSAKTQAQLNLDKARRLAEAQVRSLYHQAMTGYQQVAKQKTAIELSKKTYQAELKNYRLGAVTNIEVLQSMTSAAELQRVLDKSQYQLKVDYLSLQAATNDYAKFLEGNEQ